MGSSFVSRRTATAVLCTVALFVLLLPAPALATSHPPAATCSYDAAAGVVTVTLILDDSQLSVRQSGPDGLLLQASSNSSPENVDTLACASPEPPLTDINLLDIVVGPSTAAADGTGDDSQYVTLWLSGGVMEDSNGFDLPIDIDLGTTGDSTSLNSDLDHMTIIGADDAVNPDYVTVGAGTDPGWALADLDANDVGVEDIVQVAFSNVEHMGIHGHAGADILSLGGGGGTGLAYTGPSDVLGGPGADTMTGGDGMDTANYGSSLETQPVTVDLDAGTGLGGQAEGDTLAGFENIQGSAFNDFLYGDAGTNRISGGDGNDTIGADFGDDYEFGNGGNDVFTQGEIDNGADTLDGGDGTDSILYCGRSVQVSVTNNGIADDGEPGENDNASGIENHSPAGALGCATVTPASCSFDTTTGAVSAGAGSSAQLVFSRTSGGTIEVSDGSSAVSCGSTAPTVSTTSSISVTDPMTAQSTQVTLDFTNGAFVPGSASESDSLSEIEFSLGLGDGSSDKLVVIGTSSQDSISAATSSSLDIGRDGDADVTLTGVEDLQVDGRGGDDRFSFTDLAIDLVLNGGDGGDHLGGGAAASTLNGGEGFDVFFATAGAEQMNGDAGEDLAYYVDSPSGVTVDLATGSASGGWAQGDTFGINSGGLTTIENVNGSNNGSNNLIGNASTNWLAGGPMADTLSGGGGGDFLAGYSGADVLDGGAGVDALNYMDSPAGVRVNLALGIFEDGYGTEDTVVQVGGQYSIEDVRGSGCHPQACLNDPSQVNDATKADILIGDGRANRLEGFGGPDHIEGGGGDDVLNGYDGNDEIHGGEGNDQIPQNVNRDGADNVHGDGGTDWIMYNDRSLTAVVTTSDNLPNDGEVPQNQTDLGERDNIRSTIEVVVLPRLPWPDCSSTQTTQCVQDFSFTNADPAATAEQLARMTADVRMEQYQDNFEDSAWIDLNVLYERGNSSDVFGDRDVIADGAPLTADSVVTVKLALGDIDPTMMFTTGEVAQIDGVSQVTFGSDASGHTVELKLKPRPLELVEPDEFLPSGCQIDDCGDDSTLARRGFQGAIGAQIISQAPASSLSGQERVDFENYLNTVRGSWVSTNAQAWTRPYAEDGAFRFRLAAAHLDHNGELYQGFFSAFLPTQLLIDEFGLTAEEVEALTSEDFAVDVTKSGTTDTKAPTAQSASSGTIEGVRVTLDDFTYSSPAMAIRQVPASSSGGGGTSAPSPSASPTPTTSPSPKPSPSPEVTAPPSGGTIERDDTAIEIPAGGDPVEVVGDGNTVTVDGDRDVTISGENNTVTISGDSVTLMVAGDANRIIGTGSGGISVNVNGSANEIDLGEGDDDLTLSGRGNSADLGGGNDSTEVSGGVAVAATSDASSTLDNVIYGRAGADRLISASSSDHLVGGAGSDVITGGGGGDRLAGGTGTDAITGGTGHDKLFGGGANDVLRGGRGADELRGGDGRDRLYSDRKDTVVKGGPGRDTVM